MWQFLQKKIVLLVSRGKNEVSSLLEHPRKNLFDYLWKNPLLPLPHEKILVKPMAPDRKKQVFNS